MSCVYSPTHDTSCSVGCVSEWVGFNINHDMDIATYLAITPGAKTSKTPKEEPVYKATVTIYI